MKTRTATVVEPRPDTAQVATGVYVELTYQGRTYAHELLCPMAVTVGDPHLEDVRSHVVILISTALDLPTEAITDGRATIRWTEIPYTQENFARRLWVEDADG